MLHHTVIDFSTVSPVPFEDAYFTGRIKTNPRTGEVLENVVASRPIFRGLAVEERGGGGRAKRAPAEGQEADHRRGRARARKRLFELAACNDFDLFCTLTLDKKKVDRYDYHSVITPLNTWLDNRVRRRGLRYILVPELHKDGAIHFHGLCNSEAMRLVESGIVRAGKASLNVADWVLGFSQAVRLDGPYERVCNYVAKYITKGGDEGPIGGRYFLKGGDLRTAICTYYNEDYTKVAGKVVEIEDGGLTLVYRG